MIDLDTYALWKDRYAKFQQQQRQVEQQYYQTVKAPQIEKEIEEMERQRRQAEVMLKQSGDIEEVKQSLKRDFFMNNRQLLLKQLEDKEKMKSMELKMKNYDLEEVQQKVNQSKNMEFLQQNYDKQKKINYKAMLDNQINVRNQLQLYGNMTSVEKQINKQDLEAYKNMEVTYNSMLPGLNNAMNYKAIDGSAALSSSLSKSRGGAPVLENMKRLDQYGYNRSHANLINMGGSQTSRITNDRHYMVKETNDMINTQGLSPQQLTQTMDNTFNLRSMLRCTFND